MAERGIPVTVGARDAVPVNTINKMSKVETFTVGADVFVEPTKDSLKDGDLHQELRDAANI